MKKTRVLLVVLLAVFVGFLAACTSTEDLLATAKDELVAHYAETLSDEEYEVTANVTLITTIGDATISWTSSNTAVLTAAGVVTRPDNDTNVTLTATLTIDGETITHQFRIVVKAREITVAEQLEAAKALLVAQYATTIGDDEYEVMADLSLVTTIGGAAVSWSSSEPTIITNAGVVTRPVFAVGDQTVTLTATLTIGSQSVTQVFYAFVLANAKTVNETLQEVLAVVTTFPAVEGITGAETWLEFPATIVVGDTTYNVVWTSSHPDVLGIDATVTRPASGEANVLVTMTASITVGSVTETMEKDFLVFAYESSTLLASIAEVYTVEAGTYVKFEGVTVIGKMSGGTFFTDGTTVIYVFDTTTIYNSVQIGQAYDLEGVFGYYFNAPQLANDVTRPLKATPSSATPASLDGRASTVNDAIATKPAPSGANPMVYDYISVTGKLVIDNQETADVVDGIRRYNTFMVDTTFEGTQVIKTLASGKATEYNTPAIVIYYQSPSKVALSALDGETITINILLYGWRTDRNVWYAVYFGDTTDIEVQFANDTEAVAAVKEGLTQPATVTTAATLELLAAQYGATITWASSDEALINSTTGVVTPTAGQQITVTLTATITKGEVTDTKVFTIKVGELPLSTVAEVILVANTTAIRTKGIVTAAEYYRTYFIQDATGGIAVYTSNATLLAFLKANIGKEVEVTGTRGAFNGLRQIAPTEIKLVGDATLPTPMNIDALELTVDALLPYQGQLVSITQLLVTNRTVDQYGNVTLVLSKVSEGRTFQMKWDSRTALGTAAAAVLADIAINDVLNITNVLAWNNNPFFYFTDTTIVTETTLTEANKVNVDAAALTVPATAVEATTFTLPTTGANGSTIVWSSNNTDLITAAGVVTMPVSGQVTVTLTATVTLGAASKEVTFEVLVGVPAEPMDTLVQLFDFGTVAKTGYAVGNVTFTNTTGPEYVLAKDRAQINVSTFTPHDTMGAFLVLAPISTVKTSFVEFDFTSVTGLKKMEFSFATWSGTALTNIQALTDFSFRLEYWDTNTSAWVAVANTEAQTNLVSLFSSTAYATVTYNLTIAAKYRLVYEAPTATSTSNTAYAITVDNLKIYN